MIGSKLKNVLITGANGFVGRALCRKLQADGVKVHGAVRANKSSSLPEGVEPREIANIDALTDWTGILGGIDTVVHLAARVHVMQERAADPIAEYHKVNVAGTRQLACAAREAEVKRFVFLSTIKVNGEKNVRPYRESDPPAPEDAYAISKLQAEEQLKEIAAASGMELVILRPPLVYGPGVKANFLALIKMVAKGVPLPLANIPNRRSFIYLKNLTDVISACCIHPDAGGKVFIVSDGEDVSTPELIRCIAESLNVPARLFPCPALLLFFFGRILGKGAALDRLIGSLAVDISRIRKELDWEPPYTLEQGMKETASWYIKDFRKPISP
ncbi:MAG: SDR family oxidoreductase [Desulfobacterales bacterium]|nr:MAG: SDR family oxidoreductase [Desulfobacterales bacterium]